MPEAAGSPGAAGGGYVAGRSGGEAVTAVRHTADGSIRADRDQLRRAAEIDAKVRGAIDQQRRLLAEQRAELEQRVASAEAELARRKEAALEIQSEGRDLAAAVAAASNIGAAPGGGPGAVGAADAFPETEEVAAAVREINESVAEVRRRTDALREDVRTQLEVDRCLSGLYDGMTGIRWDHATHGTSGYVALDTVKRFEVAGLDQVDAAESIWQTIEASLKPGSMGARPHPPAAAPRAA